MAQFPVFVVDDGYSESLEGAGGHADFATNAILGPYIGFGPIGLFDFVRFDSLVSSRMAP